MLILAGMPKPHELIKRFPQLLDGEDTAATKQNWLNSSMAWLTSWTGAAPAKPVVPKRGR